MTHDEDEGKKVTDEEEEEEEKENGFYMQLESFTVTLVHVRECFDKNIELFEHKSRFKTLWLDSSPEAALLRACPSFFTHT